MERFQGQLDIPLNDTGKQQAKELGDILKNTGEYLEVILSSDLSRALETAKAVSQGLGGIPIITDKDLREGNVGDAQGKFIRAIKMEYGEDMFNRWNSYDPSDGDFSFPNGETGNQILNRAITAMKAFLNKTDKNCIGISTHGGIIRRLVRLLSLQNSIKVTNACVIKLYYDTEKSLFSWPKDTKICE